jgi:hypothetical protein
MKTHYRRGLWTFAIVVVVLVVARIALPYVVLDYLNGRLARMGDYAGHIDDIDIHLWRGAYSIDDLVIEKVDGKVPVPLFKSSRADIALSWRALSKGRIRGKVDFIEPEINFVDGSGKGDTQTGRGVDWRAQLKALVPIRLDEVNVFRGKVTFNNFVSSPKVDLEMTEVYATATNLTNVQRAQGKRIAELHATAKVLGDAPLETAARFDPLERRGDFQYQLTVRDIKLVKANDLARAYSGLDFASGSGDFVMQLEARDGRLDGYAKPLFHDLKVFSWKQDVEQGDKNPLHIAYEMVAQGVTWVFKNHGENQFATRVPISGRIDQKNLDTGQAILGVLRNAFVEAYRPNLEKLDDRPDGRH